jgi:hypothetical protein
MEKIEAILIPGTYKGHGFYDPTKKYPNGISTTNKVKIEKDKGCYLKITNEITCYDAKTKQKLWNGRRKTIIYQDTNDKSKYVYESKSYINKKIVSSQYGILSKINEKSKTLTVKLVYSYWFITNVVYNNSCITFTRDQDKLKTVFKHDGKTIGEKPNITFTEYFELV